MSTKKTTVLMGASAAQAAGTAICQAAQRATQENSGPDNALRHTGRGVCIYAMDNIWYGAMTDAAKAKFNYDKDAFYTKCGWPD